MCDLAQGKRGDRLWQGGGFQRVSDTRVPGWGHGPGQLLELGKVRSRGSTGTAAAGQSEQDSSLCQQANTCRVWCIPRCGHGKSHSIKINEPSCNFN